MAVPFQGRGTEARSTVKTQLVGSTESERNLHLPSPKCQTSIIKSSVSAVVDDQKTSRTLKPFDKGFEGVIKSSVRLSIWNQGSFDPESIGLPKDRGQLIYFSANSKIVIFPAEQKNVHSSISVPNLLSPKLSGSTMIAWSHGPEDLEKITTRLRVTYKEKYQY